MGGGDRLVEPVPGEGYLLLADISGYTRFLVGTELAHAHAIIRELTSLVRDQLVPPLRFVKLEGDAVFCYVDGTVFRDGERFLEAIEACYFAFTSRLTDMTRSTTCTCRACVAITSLDLKFLAHYGEFIVDVDEGREDLAGRDVIVVHRLLKNSIADLGFESGFAFFTDACLERLPPTLRLPSHAETHDGLGTTTGGVHDLRPVAAEMRQARARHLTAADADVETVASFAAPAALVWQYYVDPVERQRWVCLEPEDEPDVVTVNDAGRVGRGASFHCNHGPGTWFREFLEWRPFTAFTCRTVAPGAGPAEQRSVLETMELAPTPDGTRATVRVRAEDRSPEHVEAFRAFGATLDEHWRRSHDALAAVIAADAAAGRA